MFTLDYRLEMRQLSHFLHNDFTFIPFFSFYFGLILGIPELHMQDKLRLNVVRENAYFHI